MATPVTTQKPPPLTKEQARDLCRRSWAGDRDARNELVEHSLGLVHSLASRYHGQGLDHDDLAGEGILGLIAAAETYDPDGPASFATYAYYYIRKSMTAALRQAGAVHESEKVGRNRRGYARRVAELGAAAARERYTAARLAVIDRPPPRRAELPADLTAAEPDRAGPDPDELAALEVALLTLAPLDRWLLCQIYGLGHCNLGQCLRGHDDPCLGGPPRSRGRSIVELARLCGCTPLWIQILRNRALDRLRIQICGYSALVPGTRGRQFQVRKEAPCTTRSRCSTIPCGSGGAKPTASARPGSPAAPASPRGRCNSA